ncbi:TPA: hypothetical protein ACOQ6D_003570 [Bacillus cereus]
MKQNMTILHDPWFTVKQIAQNTYAISEYGHWEKIHSILTTKKVFPYTKTPLSFKYSIYSLY